MRTFFDILNELGSVHIKMNGKGFSDLIKFDFKNKRISNGSIVLCDNGKVIPQTITLHGYSIELTEDMTPDLTVGSYEEVEELYARFKDSVSEPYAEYTTNNFVAKDIDTLTREQFADGCNRQSARIALESYVMFHKFEWSNPKYHYWQSRVCPDLIIYKDWITVKE